MRGNAGACRHAGTPQGDPAHRVGEIPNLAAALKQIEVDPPGTAASFAPDGTVTLTGDDGWGSGVDRIEYRLDGGAWTTYTVPFKPAAGTRVLEHRATDDTATSAPRRRTRWRWTRRAPRSPRRCRSRSAVRRASARSRRARRRTTARRRRPW
jgi:hypothetical protein